MRYILKVYYTLMLLFVWPHLLFYVLSSQKEKIKMDASRREKKDSINVFDIAHCIIFIPEFRNIFYVRLGNWSRLLKYIRPLNSLYIWVPKERLGAGLFVQHGFSTVICADSVGDNCMINQQVTIGYKSDRKLGLGRPKIGNNVRIACGAKVLGPITIGDNSVIGANAVVTKDVPPNSVIVPAEMRYLYQDGVRVDKPF